VVGWMALINWLRRNLNLGKWGYFGLSLRTLMILAEAERKGEV